ATSETRIENTTLVGASLHGYHATSGTGLAATSQWGMGLRAESSTDVGVRAFNTEQTPSSFSGTSHQTAVLATCGQYAGLAHNTDETAIYGFCDVSTNATGVWGDSVNGTGLVGTGETGLYASGGIAGVVADC